MAIDALSLAVTQALFYAISPYNYTDSPSINLTEFSTTRWWGPSSLEASGDDTNIYSYNVTYNSSMISDLKSRINTTLNAPRNFTTPLNDKAFQYGFNPNQTARWLKFWLNDYNFTAQETFWNTFSLYQTEIQGMKLVYARKQPASNTTKSVIPLMLLHGWPSSIREFYSVIPLLAAESSDRDYVFDIIVPCLPGFGFSEGPTKEGLGAAQIAVVLRNLVQRIGYKRFYIQGGDFGALIGGHMATLFPDNVLGYHTNWGVLLSPVAILLQILGTIYPPLVVRSDLYSRMYPITTRFTVLTTATGYLHMQATRPDTIGVALTDSPASLLAYVFEKYATANNKSNGVLADGGLFESTTLTPTYLIDSLMYFWSTHSIQTAMRIYANTFCKKHFNLRMEEIPTFVPTWVVQASDEFTYQSPIILGLKYKNMINVTALTKGGHFLASGEPELFTDSVFTAVTAFRAWHVTNGTNTTVKF